MLDVRRKRHNNFFFCENVMQAMMTSERFQSTPHDTLTSS